MRISRSEAEFVINTWLQWKYEMGYTPSDIDLPEYLKVLLHEKKKVVKNKKRVVEIRKKGYGVVTIHWRECKI